MDRNSYDDKVMDAQKSCKAAAKRLSELLREAGFDETADKILTEEGVHIHEIAVCINKIEDEGLRESMHKCISRYTRANSEVIENKVKSDLFEDLKSGLRSFAQDLEDHKRKD